MSRQCTPKTSELLGCTVPSQPSASVPEFVSLYLPPSSLLEWAAITSQAAIVGLILSTPKPTSPWRYKPWWCQPWSILLTGALIIATSWVFIKIVWVTILVSLPILLWWTYFLVLWPELIRRSGSLDNY
ncbi:MAG TPA: DUF6737 family protein [Waterburya sp.]